jgi:hypothetical protein
LLEDAVVDLMRRERTVSRLIGYASACANSGPDKSIGNVIFSRLESTDYDAAVWTALPSNYEKRLSAEFSLEHGTQYLTTLPKNAKKRALEYIPKTPKQIDTRLRQHLRAQNIFS